MAPVCAAEPEDFSGRDDPDGFHLTDNQDPSKQSAIPVEIRGPLVESSLRLYSPFYFYFGTFRIKYPLIQSSDS